MIPGPHALARQIEETREALDQAGRRASRLRHLAANAEADADALRDALSRLLWRAEAAEYGGQGDDRCAQEGLWDI